jgi:hypothetical protein
MDSLEQSMKMVHVVLTHQHQGLTYHYSGWQSMYCTQGSRMCFSDVPFTDVLFNHLHHFVLD